MSEKEKLFGLRLKWLGCACFELDFGGLTVVSDPWITPSKKHDLTWEAVERCDYITLSHGHFDHTLDIPALVEKFNPGVLCGEGTAVPLLKWADINPMKVYPMSPDLELDFDAVKIRALFGRHIPLAGKAAARAEWAKNHVVNHGDPNLIELAFWGDLEYRNFLYTMPNGTSVLLWGSKLGAVEQRNILRGLHPDIAIMQMTVNSAADTAAICAEMGCKVVLPHHIDFPGDYMPLVLELREELAKQVPGIRCIIPEYGTWISL
jgi:L-ascorbate metabolism protein UlaG (beta-lactamase superfamily)